MIGGVWVEDRHVRALAAIVDGPVARRLEQALLFRAQVVAMTRDGKKAVLSALERAPADLDELREVLLANEDWLAGRGSSGAPGQPP